MSLESNSQYAAVVKQEYLPPPLENNYLSLFDIQAKMAQEFLHGTDEEKIATIKKRIKKFFDYGNDRPNEVDLTNDSNSFKKLQYPPVDAKEDIHTGLKIFSTQIILYGKDEISFQIAETLFPGFIGSQKIDDCNIKLIFAKDQDCKKILKQISKDKGTITIDHIMNPSQIQWFEVELEPKHEKDPVLVFHARFATNKDEVLFENDKYFRRLLGRARHLIDKKQEEDQKRQIEIKQKAQRKALIQQRRKVTVNRNDYKSYSKDFDTVTHYDGIYSERPYQKYENSREVYFNQSLEEPQHLQPGQKNWRKSKEVFDNLNISEIQDREFYEQKKYQYKPRKRDFYRSNSTDSIDFGQVNQKKRRPEKFMDNPREKMIKAHREKSTSKYEKKSRFCDSEDYDREYERRIERSKKPYYDID